MSNETELHKAYVRLKALRDNLPDAVVLEQHWVADFHTLVEMLANPAGADLRSLWYPIGRLSSNASRRFSLRIHRRSAAHPTDGALSGSGGWISTRRRANRRGSHFTMRRGRI